jgi:hypothetical protein
MKPLRAVLTLICLISFCLKAATLDTHVVVLDGSSNLLS